MMSSSVILKAVLGAARSLTSSTDLVLTGRSGIRVTLTRKNSPHRSHQGVTYSKVAPLSANNTVLLRANNDGRTLIVANVYADPASWGGLAKAHEEVGTLIVPSALVWGLLEEAQGLGILARSPRELDPNGLVMVGVTMSRLLGYEEDGTPIFQRPGDVVTETLEEVVVV